MNYGETIKNWSIKLDDKEQTFRFEHQFWTGRKKYYVNDELIKHVRGSILASCAMNETVAFTIDGHEGEFIFRHRSKGLHNPFDSSTVYIDLFIDGEKVDGRKTKAKRQPNWVYYTYVVLILSLALYLQVFSDIGQEQPDISFHKDRLPVQVSSDIATQQPHAGKAKNLVGQKVRIVMESGEQYTGTLISVDGSLVTIEEQAKYGSRETSLYAGQLKVIEALK